MALPPEKTVLFVYNAGLVARLVGKAHFAGKQWQLGAGTFSIGRDPTNNLVLDAEPGISKVHCKVTLENSQFVLVDAESRNGTLLNGAPVKRQVLRNGDEIRICNVVLGFEQLGGEQSPSLPAPVAAPVPAPVAPPSVAPPAAEATMRRASPPVAPPPVFAPPPRSVVPYFAGGAAAVFLLLGGVSMATGVVTVGAPASKPPRASGDRAPDKPRERPGDGDTVQREPRAAEPKAGAEPAGAEFDGVLRAVASVAAGGVEVKHTQNARVASISVKPGKEVRKGAVLLVYDDAEAQRRLATARVQYESIKEVAESQDTERARKFLAEAKVDLDRATAAVGGMKLLAPQDGVVADVQAEAGKRAGKGTTAVVFAGEGGEAAPPSWKAVFNVPAEKAGAYADGTTVTVSSGGANVEARVESSERTAEGARVTASLSKPPPGASDGATVKVR